MADFPDHPDSGPRISLTKEELDRCKLLGRCYGDDEDDRSCYWSIYDLDGRTIFALSDGLREGIAWECSMTARKKYLEK